MSFWKRLVDPEDTIRGRDEYGPAGPGVPASLIEELVLVLRGVLGPGIATEIELGRETEGVTGRETGAEDGGANVQPNKLASKAFLEGSGHTLLSDSSTGDCESISGTSIDDIQFCRF